MARKPMEMDLLERLWIYLQLFYAVMDLPI
jgi:hypothetical protein